jgi:hypothetical protein
LAEAWERAYAVAPRVSIRSLARKAQMMGGAMYQDAAGNPLIRESFYDDADQVRFGPLVSANEYAAYGVAAMSMFKLGMMIGDVAPILSLPQVFDNPLVLNLLAPADGMTASERSTFQAERKAFLSLVSDGWVRLGVRGEPHETPLSTAFFRALGNDDFILSGWPELQTDIKLRHAVHDCLSKEPQKLDSLVSATTYDQYQGLLDLEHNLMAGYRRQMGSIKFVPSTSSTGKVVSLHESIKGAAANEPHEVQDLARWVESRANKLREAGDIRAGNLENRSTWYTLINQCDLESCTPTEQRAALDIVNAEYNTIVAESLNAAGKSITCRETDTAQRLALAWNIAEGVSARVVELIPYDREKDWLTWSTVSEKLVEVAIERQAGRADRVAALYDSWRAQDSIVVAVKHALPGAGIMAGVTTIGAAVTGVPPHYWIPAGATAGSLELARQVGIRMGNARWPEKFLRRMY